MSKRRFSRAALAISVLALLPILPSPLPARIGEIDFRAYWSASYLLVRGENFADPGRLYEVERDQTGWQEAYPMITWNPPSLLLLLFPYTLAPYDRAVWLWMLTNIALVFLSAMTLWQLSANGAPLQRQVWIPLLIAFAYSPTLVALIAGQVNLLVLSAVVLFLFLHERGRAGWAGVALAITLIKPHLVYLTVPILLLDFMKSRQWRALIGFAGVLIGLSVLVFFLRPTLLSDYATTVSRGQLLEYETPTLGGALQVMFGWWWSKWIPLMVLPIVVLLWYRGMDWSTRKWVEVTLLASLITAPFAWSYDFVVLLVPLFRIVTWMDKFRGYEKIGLVSVLIAANAVSFYQRVLTPSELYFLWIPLGIAALYIYCTARVNGISTVRIR